jgi:Flp pilus assembly pilin Flp
MKRAQSFVEYTLLVAVALIGLLITINSFLKGDINDSLTSHFNTVKGRISTN